MLQWYLRSNMAIFISCQISKQTHIIWWNWCSNMPPNHSIRIIFKDETDQKYHSIFRVGLSGKEDHVFQCWLRGIGEASLEWKTKGLRSYQHRAPPIDTSTPYEKCWIRLLWPGSDHCGAERDEGTAFCLLNLKEIQSRLALCRRKVPYQLIRDGDEK